MQPNQIKTMVAPPGLPHASQSTASATCTRSNQLLNLPKVSNCGERSSGMSDEESVWVWDQSGRGRGALLASMQRFIMCLAKRTYLHLRCQRVEAWLESEGECVERKEQRFPVCAACGLLQTILYNTTL